MSSPVNGTILLTQLLPLERPQRAVGAGFGAVEEDLGPGDTPRGVDRAQP